MRIMVRTLRGDRVALDVDAATTTVAQVKGMVAAQERVPEEVQRLFFAGRLLDDDDAPVARYGVQDGSVIFLSLRLRDDAPPQHEVRNVQTQPEPVTVRQEESQQQQLQMHIHDDDDPLIITKTRKPVSRRALRKILSHLHVDVWTTQHDAKFIDLLYRHTARRRCSADDLTADDWSSIRAELNAATRSSFPVEDLQRRLVEFRREFDAVSRIRSHPGFGYDARRRVVVASEAEWKRYVLENPEAAAYEGKSNPHLGRLRAIFSGYSGGGGAETRGHGGGKCCESRAKRCLNKLLRSLGLRCKF